MTMTNQELADAIAAGLLACALHGNFSTAGATCEKHLAELQAEQARRAKAPVIDERVLMPRALTAENGAKAALMGEFEQTVEFTCQECAGNGYVDSDENASCGACDGLGTVDLAITISWPTIKAIYVAAVKLFHPEVPV